MSKLHANQIAALPKQRDISSNSGFPVMSYITLSKDLTLSFSLSLEKELKEKTIKQKLQSLNQTTNTSPGHCLRQVVSFLRRYVTFI